jgi:hypothetical protein
MLFAETRYALIDGTASTSVDTTDVDLPAAGENLERLTRTITADSKTLAEPPIGTAAHRSPVSVGQTAVLHHGRQRGGCRA